LSQSFGDDARSPRSIQTVARSGYRLIAATNRRRTPVVRTLLAIGPPTRTYWNRMRAVTSSDGRLVAFDRPVQAVRLALALQAREGALPIGITTARRWRESSGENAGPFGPRRRTLWGMGPPRGGETLPERSSPSCAATT